MGHLWEIPVLGGFWDQRLGTDMGGPVWDAVGTLFWDGFGTRVPFGTVLGKFYLLERTRDTVPKSSVDRPYVYACSA